MSNVSRSRVIARLAGVAVLGLVTAVSAQTKPTTVAEIALYRGADRQAVLEAGARKEGKILIYTVGTQIKPVIKEFEKKYPYIKVELFRAGSAKIARKVVEEYRAGYYKVDGFELASHGLIIPRDRKILQPFYSPETAAYQDDAKEAGGHWVVVRESYTGIGINTKLVSAEEAPKTYEDLLAPRWKNKLALSGRASTAGNWVGTLLITKGEAFVRKLGKQNIRVYEVSGRALTNLMTSGEVPISVTTYNSHVPNSNRKGASLVWFAPGPVPVTDTGVAIASKAPNPHATMLLLDFLLTKESQKLYQKLGYASARKDIKNRQTPAKKLYLTSRPNFVTDFEKWVRLYREVFVRRK